MTEISPLAEASRTPDGVNNHLETHPLPNSTKILISDLVMSCSELEHICLMALLKFCKVNYTVGFGLLAQKKLTSVLGSFKLLVGKTGDKEFFKDFSAFCKDVQEIQKVRNHVAHGLYRGVLRGTELYVFSSPHAMVQNGQVDLIEYSAFVCDEKAIHAAAHNCGVAIDWLRNTFDARPFYEEAPEQILSDRAEIERLYRSHLQGAG